MNIELKEHNEIAYKKIKEHFTSFDRTCIVHCTGSGKSYVALKLIEDCIKNNSSVLFVTMSRELEKQFKNDQLAILYKIHRVDPEFLEKINQKLTITRYSALKKLGSKSAYDYIILDEFHRAGAKVTSKNIEKLLNNNQGAKILGVSATPIREKGRNMAEELFHGNLASKIDLYDAIEKHHIIPRPEYIACVYDEQTELRKLLDLFSLPKYAKIYEQPTSLITKARKALENGTVTGLEWIFERYMTNINAKYLVFCNNINHLKLLMKKAEDEWFNWSQYPVYTYYQHSKDNPRGKNYEAFVKSDKVGIKLMFCVNMFTTGVHSKNIDGIINFRSTKIVPLYLQIIGRTLTCGRNFANPPQIFDIVDNLETLRRRNPFSISFSKNTSISQLMEMHDLKQFDFYIESADQKIHNILEDLKKIIRTQLSWDEAYDIACEFYLKNGHLKVQKDTLINGFDLYGWLSYQRYLHNHPELNKLSQEKIKLLEDLKIDWNYSEYWDYFITQSLKIPIENGKRSITKSNCPVDSPLPKMLHNIRRAYRFGSLSKERISKLTELKIDERAYNYAKIYASLLNDEYQRKRSYASLVALYAFLNLLETTPYNIQKSMTLFRNPQVNEQYEVSDLYVNNWHLDVRVMTDGDAFLVPKVHYDNNIVPDFYLF